MKRIISVLLISMPVWIWGQEPSQPERDTTAVPLYRLNEVILVGDERQDPVLAVAKQDLARKVVQPRNVADLFADFNGFSLIKRGNYAIDPSFRASQYEQLNVQFDGGTKIMHACPNRMDPITTHVSPEEIEKIEVIKGPYTVRYGATLGGVVNLVTRDPREFGTGLHGNLSSGYESNGGSYVSTLRLQQVWDRFDLGTQIGWRDFGNYQDGGGTEIPSAFESLDYNLQLGFTPSAGQRAEVTWRQSFGRDVLHAGLPMDTETDDSSLLSAEYSWVFSKGLVRGLTAKAYHAYVDHLMTNALRPSFQMTEAEATVDARTFGGKTEIQLRPLPALTSYHGLDFTGIYRDGVRERLVKRNMAGNLLPEPVLFTDKIWQDSYVNDLGVFTEVEYTIAPNTQLTSGLRLDFVFSDIRDPEADFAALYPTLGNRSETNLSGNISLKHQITTGLLAEVAFGRGVRSANMIERFINHFMVGQDPYEYVGNPLLDAEVNHQLEVGIKGNHTFRSGPDRLRYGLSGFYGWYDNYILPVIDPELSRKYMPNALPEEVKRFINLDKAYKTGVEASLGLDFLSAFRWEAALAYTHTRNRDLGESLPLTPPLNTRFTLGYEKGSYWATLNYSITQRQDEIAPSFGEIETPGYELWDLRAGMELFKGMRLGVALLNIFDEQYNNHLNFSFVNQDGFSRTPIQDPGRNFSAYMQYQF